MLFQNIKMPQRFATYFTFAEFNSGRPSSPEQFQNALSGYHRDSVVALCSAVNCLLKTWEGGRVDPKAHDLLARTAFSADLAYRMSQARENVRDPRVAFHRQQLLFVGECGERRLNQSDGEAEKFYRDMKQRGVSVRVGMAATGYARWFEGLLAEPGIEVWIGDAAKIKTKR
jgi:hypothetical protein